MRTGSEKLRSLRVEDIPAAAKLSAQAGWNQTEEDWRTLLELSPRRLSGNRSGWRSGCDHDSALLWAQPGVDRDGSNQGRVSATRLCQNSCWRAR